MVGLFETMIITLSFGLTCLPESKIDRSLLVASGALLFMSQIFLVLSTKLENAATVALLRKAFDMVMAFIIQIVIFHVSEFVS